MKKLIREAPTVNDEILKESRTEVSTQPKTNGGRIRQMTDEELADALILDFDCTLCSRSDRSINRAGCHGDCYAGVLEWLKQEARENG